VFLILFAIFVDNMQIGSFGSGSKQNCFYLLHERKIWLIDLGISFRRLQKYLEILQCDISCVQGLLITHDHEDHTRGVFQFARQTNIPIYMHQQTSRFLALEHRTQEIQPYQTYHFEDFSFFPFPLIHDAVFHMGFLIKTSEGIMLYASDVGKIDNHLLKYAPKASIIAIEANYDEEMLAHSWYPPHLKQRICGGQGHLSNVQTREFLFKVISPKTKKEIFLHLSENNNTKERVKETIIEPLQASFPHVDFFIAEREEWVVY